MASPTKQMQCIDLSAAEFHIMLHDINAPADARRWSLDLKDGELTLRLWNDALSHCRAITVNRVGVTPTVHARDRIAPGTRIDIKESADAVDQG